MTIINTRPTLIAFLADKNGTNQTGVSTTTWTAVTFGTERYDVGSAFASNVWTPPAGKVFLQAAIHVTGNIAANAVSSLGIYKNGSLFAEMLRAGTANNYYSAIAIDDIANGTDYYGVYIYETSTGNGTVSGVAYETYFTGCRYAL